MKKTYEKPSFVKTMYISTDTMAQLEFQAGAGDTAIFNGGFIYAKAEGYAECNCTSCPPGTNLCVEVLSCDC